MDQGFSVSGKASGDPLDRAAQWLARPPVQLGLILLGVIAVYAHTLGVPFYFDDFTSIRENPAIREGAAGAWEFSRARFVGYLTFALNYALHDYQLAGYHVVNILVHAGAAGAVYWLTRLLLRTERLAPHVSEATAVWLPLLVAGLFALHPLQTQAVTYITQRLASMAALFYLLSMASYLSARLARERREQLLGFAGAGLFAALAFFTKQNTATLPFALLLMEVCFLGADRRILGGALAAVVFAALAMAAWFAFVLDRSFLEFLARSTEETTTVTRWQYLALQMQVLWDYIGKFFLPLTLHLDYDLPVPETFFNGKTLLFALGHLALIGGAGALLRRSPVIAFAILFYYTAHLVESSLIPIRDFAFEHRTYLPNAGLCLLAAWAACSLLPRLLARRTIAAASVAVVLGFSVLAWARNDTWRDPVAFFQHEIAVNPDNFRAHSMLGENYMRLGQHQAALETYRDAAPLYEDLVTKETNTEVAFFSNFILALNNTGNYEEARALIDDMDLASLPDWAHALFLSRRGIIHANQGRYRQAEADFRAAIELDDSNIDAHVNYAKVLLVTGRPEQARAQFQRAYEIDPNHPEAISGLQYFENNAGGAEGQ